MKPTITPIQTNYKGHYFRSRLEARWAVFFRELNIPFLYEKDAFKLGTLRCYLPDFWLELPEGICDECNTSGYWFEVKGGRTCTSDMEKCQQLAIKTRHSSIIVVGDPVEFNYRKFSWYDGACSSFNFNSEWVDGKCIGPVHRSLLFRHWNVSPVEYDYAAKTARSYRF
jgi:hypothetical protein